MERCFKIYFIFYLQLSHVLEHEYLDEQVNAIKELGDKISQLKRAGKGLGEYLFDQKM